MIETGVSGVDFIAMNTDIQALAKFGPNGINIPTLNIGKEVTRGLGAGGIPDNGRKAAEESRNDIMNMIKGSDLVFVTAGMGGGTGSGAAPIVAEIAREAGALTVGVVTKPFGFEGKRRMSQAVQAIEKLVDALGGVTVYVPKDMKYQDDSQHLYINLKEGKQHLDGDKTLQLLRFRKDNLGDIGRIQRQQMVTRALVEQALKPLSIQ
jgi:cell division protein FtsZ